MQSNHEMNGGMLGAEHPDERKNGKRKHQSRVCSMQGAEALGSAAILPFGDL